MIRASSRCETRFARLARASISLLILALLVQSETGLENDIQLARSMWDEVTVAAGHRLAPTFFSLREYMSILYLNPRMQVQLPFHFFLLAVVLSYSDTKKIWIRGHKVNLRKLEYCLHKPRQYSYRPRAADKSEKVEITMGFNKVLIYTGCTTVVPLII